MTSIAAFILVLSVIAPGHDVQVETRILDTPIACHEALVAWRAQSDGHRTHAGVCVIVKAAAQSV